MRPWNKGKGQKRELNTTHPTVSLPCKWSGFAFGKERFCTSSKEFPISLMSLNETNLNFHVILSVVIWSVARHMEIKSQF